MNPIERSMAIRNRGKYGVKVVGMVAGVNALWLTAMVTMAGTGVWGNATGKVSEVFTTLETALKTVVVPIAGCALLACFIIMMVSQNQKKVEMYRNWCITIFISIVAIYAVPFIITMAKDIGSKF